MNGANEVVESWKNIVHAMERDWPRLRQNGAEPGLRQDRSFASEGVRMLSSTSQMALGPPG